MYSFIGANQHLEIDWGTIPQKIVTILLEHSRIIGCMEKEVRKKRFQMLIFMNRKMGL